MPHSLLLRFYLFLLVLLVIGLCLSPRGETRTRALTLVALLSIVSCALWVGPVTWTVLVGCIAVLVAWELGNSPAQRAAAVGLALAGGAAVVALHAPPSAVAAVAWAVAAGMLLLPGPTARRPTFTAALALGLIGPGTALLAELGWSRPPSALLALILLVQMNDAFGYLAGRRLGRTRLFPATSPNKSLEGYAAGAISLALGILVLHTLVPALPSGHDVVRGAVVFAAALVAANAGDLAVSAFKRRRGVKDSGRLLPGHGGALDRFGNILLAAPVFAMLLAAGVL